MALEAALSSSSLLGQTAQNTTDEFQELSMNMWLRAVPARVAMAHTNLSEAEINTIPDKAVPIL